MAVRRGWIGKVELNEVSDSSGLAHHGLAEDNAQPSRSGRIGGAGEFDGVDDAVNLGTIPPGDRLQLTQGGTIMAWFKQEEGGVIVGSGWWTNRPGP